MTGSVSLPFLPPKLLLLLHNIEIKDVSMFLCGRRRGARRADGSHRDLLQPEISDQPPILNSLNLLFVGY